MRLPPDTLRYSCSGCGDCCRSTNVPLVGDERARLEALDWSGRVERLAGSGARAVPLAKPEAGVTHRLERGEDGACSYLADDASCLIHRHFGAEAKPLACRLYPFQLRSVDGELAVDAAFSCKAVAERMGAPLSESRVPLEALAAELGRIPEAPHALTKKQRLPGAVLRELEEGAAALLADESLDAFQRVRAALDFARLAATGDPSTDAARVLRTALLTALPKQVASRELDPETTGLDKTQRAVFFQWLWLCTNPPPPNADTAAPNERRRLERERVLAGSGWRSDDNPAWLAGRELSASFAQVAAVDAAVAREDPEGLLRDFFVGKLVGGRYLLGGKGGGEQPFAEALPKLMLWYPMAIWATKAFAADRGKKAAAPRDLRAALRLLDPPLGQVTTASLPAPQRKACDFVFLETDVVVDAAFELLS